MLGYVILAYAIAGACILISYLTAVDGYEDDQGFHYGKEQ